MGRGGTLWGLMNSKPAFFLKDDQRMDGHKAKTTARALQLPIPKTVKTEKWLPLKLPSLSSQGDQDAGPGSQKVTPYWKG